MSVLEKVRQINKKFRFAKHVFIEGHQNLDLDALGSALGMYELLTKKKKKCFIIIDDKQNELGVQKVLDKVKDSVTIITSEEIEFHLHLKKDRNLLLILDTNKPNLLSNPQQLTLFEDHIMVMDHHELNQQSISKGLIIVDNTISSTCEMITELLDYYQVPLAPFISTVLLSGIVLDTNNFILKTTAKTYYTAYFLTRMGADPRQVQYLLKQDLKQYIERQKTITGVKVIGENVALSIGSPQIIYRREDLAKIADTLLLFNEIEASFVIGKISKTAIGISSRSMGNMKIQTILEKLGGGGDNYNAAAQIENMTLQQVEIELKKQIDAQKEG